MQQKVLNRSRVMRPFHFLKPWRLLLALALLLGPVGAWAQSVASYVPARNTGVTYSSISGTGTSFSSWRNALSTDDNLSVATPIGFAFVYDGTPYTQFSVSTNGYLTLNTGTAAIGSGTGAYGYQNTQFSTAGGTVTTLAPFYDDLQTASNASTLADLNASLKYLTTGTAGNRVLTVEWVNMQDFSTTSTSSFNFQARLYEADGHIEYNYGPMTLSNSTATVSTMSYSLGINSPTGGATLANLLTQQTANTNSFGFAASDALGGNTTAGLPATGSQYTLSPSTAAVAAPITLTFATGYTSTRVNFVDNSTNETSFVLLRSTDNITFTVVGTGTSPTSAGTGAGYFFNSTGLLPGTLYYYQVLATSEGIASTPLSGSQTTATAPPASLAGTFTINNTVSTNATSTGGNFTNFTDAISTLNAATIAGSITFNVSNSQTFNETPPVITATGTAANTITFQEAALTPAVLTDNPRITPTGTVGVNDGGLVISGGDYFTFDGISVDASAGAAVEYGYLVRNATATNGALNNTFRNAAVTLNRANTVSAGVLQNSASTLGGAVVATANTGVNQNNRYLNLQIRNAYSGITLFGVSTTIVDINTEVANCAIGDPAVAGDIGNGNLTATTVAYGIRSILQSQQSIHDNTVSNVYAATTVYGISIEQSSGTGTTAGRVYNNRVSAVRNNSTSSTNGANGMRADVAATGINTLSVFNNFIWNITNGYATATATGTRIIRGIYVQSPGSGSGSFINVQFNSVRIDGSGSPNGTNTCFEVATAAGPAYDVRDNIFANFTTGQTSTSQGKHYTWISGSSTAIGNTGTVSNYNDLYVVGTPGDGTRGYIGAQGTPVTTNTSAVDRITLADWQVTPAKDANSVSVDPQFTSATDLHLQSVSPLDNIGTVIAAVTFDIDNQAGNRATTPDIGGDEFTPALDDAGVMAITQPVAPFSASTQNIAVQVKNFGVAILNTVKVDYTVNGVAQPQQAFTGLSLAPGATSADLVLGTFNFAVGGPSFIIVATTSLPNGNTDANTTNDAFTRTVTPALCGPYTVGVGQQFATLDAAVARLNVGGATCAVTFTLMDATYPATTGITINQFPGSSSTTTLTIKPGAGVSPLLTGSVASGAILKLNGADYVTIDGSNNGTSSQNLTIENTSATGSSNAVLWLAAASATDGATVNTVRNTVIRGNSAAGFPQFTVFVGSTGATPGTATATPVANSNNTFTNNAISKGFYGVFVFGPSATSLDQSNSFVGNQIGQNVAGNGFGLEGMRAVFQQGLTVVGNEIQNIASADAFSHYGLNLVTLKDATINRNSIHNVQSNSATSGKVGYGIALASTAFNTVGNASANTISNNLVYNISAPLAATSSFPNVLGIANNGGYGDKIYFNTILLNGTQTAGTGYSAALSNGDSQFSMASSVLDVRNNIIAITANVTTAAKYFGFYTSAANITGSTFDYNDYYLAGTGAATFATATLNGTTGPAYPTLANWQTATGQEANSKQVDPGFAQTTTVPFDLTPSAASLNSAGVAIAGITLDYAGTTRTSPPDIGALEFTPQTLDLKPLALLAPSATQTCFTSAEPVTVQIQNNAASTVDFSMNTATVTVAVTPPSGPVQTFTATLTSGTLGAGATQNVTFTTGGTAGNGTLDMTALGTYSFAVTATVVGDGNTANDVLTPAPTRTNAAPQAALPYLETFNASTSLPANFTTTGFSVSSTHGNASTNGLTYNLYGSSTYGGATTPALATTPVLGTTLSATNVLTFDARFVDFTSYPGTATTLSATDRVDVQVAICGGAFTTVYTINSTNYNGTGTPSLSFYNYSVPLTGVGAGQKIQVRLAAYYGAGDYYLDVDNINVLSIAPNDAGVVAITQPVAPFAPTLQPVAVQVKNFGSATLNSVTVNWTVNGTPQTPQTFTGLGLATGATSADLPLGSFDFSTGGPSFTIVATTSLPNGSTDGIPANDSFTRTVFPALTGTYTVGTGQQFTTLTSAVNVLNSAGVAGAVAFALTDAAYTTAETFPITVNTVLGGSATNTVTIKPATGVTASVSGSSTTAILKLNGADYVTIDGSNNGTASRDLSLTNTSTGTSALVVWLASVSATDGATNDVVKNLIVTGGSNTASQVGIGLLGATITASGQNNDANTVQNNFITKVSFGISAKATSTEAYDNLVVLDNVVGPAVSSATTNISTNGILLQQAPAAQVTHNTVQNVSASFSGALSAIALSTGTAGSLVNRNTVRGTYNTTTGGYGVRGISLDPGTGTANIIVRNNDVSGTLSDGDNAATLSQAIMGLGFISGTGYSVYNNTVQMSGDRANNSFTTNKVSAAVFVAAATGLDLRNNVLSNVQTSSATTAGGIGTNYAVYSQAATGTPFTAIDYNLYDIRSGAAFRTTAVSPQFVGRLAGADAADLAAWKTATGMDNSSMQANPGFTSAANLAPNPADPNSYYLNGTGVQIASVSQDLTGATRSTTVATGAPDLGAYELTPTALPNPLTVTGTYAPGSTQQFFFGGRQVASIVYDAAGTLPITLTARYYPGTNPPAPYPATARYYNAYFTFVDSGDGLGFAFTPTLNYDPALLGTIASEAAQRITRRTGTSGYIADAATVVNTTARTLTSGAPLTAFGLFTVSDAAAPLPVELTRFDATRQGADAQLTWTTASEKNNRGFEVQVSTDSRSFREIGFVAGAGSSSAPRSYAFTDRETGKAGVRYYRLRQLDFSGAVTFSPVRTVSFDLLPESELSASPNPFVGEFTLQVQARKANAAAPLTFFDATGRPVLKRQLDVPIGASKLPVTGLEGLPSGLYIVQLTVDGQLRHLKMVKQ